MRRILIAATVSAVALGAATAFAASSAADARPPLNKLAAHLRGLGEVPPISTPASGSLKLTIDPAQQTIDYELTYQDLQADARQSHIHFGPPLVNGGIILWLCQTAANPAPAVSGNVPQCPARAGTVSGRILASNIVTVAGQGIATGEWDELLALLRGGFAYANVHTVSFAGGEIRGQVVPSFTLPPGHDKG